MSAEDTLAAWCATDEASYQARHLRAMRVRGEWWVSAVDLHGATHGYGVTLERAWRDLVRQMRLTQRIGAEVSL